MSLPTPYYEQDGITIYCGDNRRIVPLLDEFDLLLTDPPYGIGYNTEATTGRGTSSAKWKTGGRKDYGDHQWDEKADEWLISLARARTKRQIIWGGNYYELPNCRGWFVWDKEANGNFADGELAWNNFLSTTRIKHHLWNGFARAGNEDRVHPTQKPLDVVTWCLGETPESKTVLDPWMGSGTTLVAAKLRGLKAVGIEINEDYCKAAVQRLSQGVLLPC